MLLLLAVAFQCDITVWSTGFAQGACTTYQHGVCGFVDAPHIRLARIGEHYEPLISLPITPSTGARLVESSAYVPRPTPAVSQPVHTACKATSQSTTHTSGQPTPHSQPVMQSRSGLWLVAGVAGGGGGSWRVTLLTVRASEEHGPDFGHDSCKAGRLHRLSGSELPCLTYNNA